MARSPAPRGSTGPGAPPQRLGWVLRVALLALVCLTGHVAQGVRVHNGDTLKDFDGYAHQGRVMTERDYLWLSAVDPVHKVIFYSHYKVASSETHRLFFRLIGDPDWRASSYFREFKTWKRSAEGCKWAHENHITEKAWVKGCAGNTFQKLTLEAYTPFDSNLTSIIQVHTKATFRLHYRHGTCTHTLPFPSLSPSLLSALHGHTGM